MLFLKRPVVLSTDEARYISLIVLFSVSSWLSPRHAAEEGVELEPGTMEVLGKVSNGDMRRAITSLQSAVRLQVSCPAACPTDCFRHGQM